MTIALNHDQIKSNSEKTTKICPFMYQYEWKGINFSSHIKDWKKFDTNNKSVALTVLFVSYKNE